MKILLSSFCLFAWLLFSEKAPLTAAVLLSLYLFLRLRDHTWIFFLVLCLLCGIPRYKTTEPVIKTARAVEVSGRTAILAKDRQRILVYTKEPMWLDGEYEILAEPEEPEISRGFYRFNSERWMRQKGVRYVLNEEDVRLIRTHSSPRYLVQKKISALSAEKRTWMYKVLLNIREDAEETDSLFYESGFSYAGILSAMAFLLKFFLDEKKRDNILLILNVLLCLFYHFPFLLVQALIFRLLKKTGWNRLRTAGIGFVLIMVLFPRHILSLSFLLPSLYHISFLFEKRRETCWWITLLLQSLFFHVMKPVQSLLYPLLRSFLGAAWLLALLSLFTGWNLSMVRYLEQFLNLTERLVLPGSILGGGLVFYGVIVLGGWKSRKRIRHALIWLLIFQMTGLFHPFAEITFINVGQGDSILVRMPLNRENVLIDTGKPAQWKNLKGYLDGQGIHHLNALFITHADDDHSGNMDKTIETYHPEQIVTEHCPETVTGRLVFHDLNDLKNEDENESSLAHAFAFNGLTVLLTGDMDQKAEERIAMKYSSLHADLLKLSHHGSKTGSSPAFLDTLKPELAVISSGPYRMYHHPSPEVIQRLMKRHIPCLDTKKEGDIRLTAIGPFNILMTSSGRTAVLLHAQ